MKVSAATKALIEKVAPSLNGKIQDPTPEKVEQFLAIDDNITEITKDPNIQAGQLRNATVYRALTAVLSGDSLEVESTSPPVDRPEEVPANDDTPPIEQIPTQPQDQTSPPDKKEGGWGQWGTLVLGILGVLASIGALFSSEEGAKGKTIFGWIGGLLLGGAILSQWPGVGKVFGSALEFVKDKVNPQAAGTGGS